MGILYAVGKPFPYPDTWFSVALGCEVSDFCLIFSWRVRIIALSVA